MCLCSYWSEHRCSTLADLSIINRTRGVRRLNHTNFLNWVIHICLKGPSFLKVFEYIDHDVHGEVNTTPDVWTNLMLHTPRLSHNARVYIEKKD